jgi:energy-coupling factor transport system ATP-binding protein
MNVSIRIEALSFTYPSGVHALAGVTLSVAPGEKVALVGQNGAGKTTLVKHLNGLLKPTTGRVLVGDWDTRDKSVAQLAAQVGYVFQNPDDQLFQSNVWAELAFGPRNLGWPPERVAQQVNAAMQAVGLAQARDRHPYDLSPSQRKSVALAAVLAMDTPILVLDEPTTGLDFAGVEQIGQIVDRMAEQGKTVLTITHDIDFCAEHFPRVVVMAHGQVLLDGSAREVLANADVLAQTYVEPPQLVRLAARLDIKPVPLTVVEFVSSLNGS